MFKNTTTLASYWNSVPSTHMGNTQPPVTSGSGIHLASKTPALLKEITTQAHINIMKDYKNKSY